MTEVALVTDVGGTQIRVALVDRTSHIVKRVALPTNAQEGRHAVLERLIGAFREVLASTEDTPVGIGITMPGPIDPDSGVLYNPPNLPGWDRFSLKPVFEREFRMDVSLGNDANLAGLAEHRFGAGVGHRNILYLTVSTGVGGAVIIDNRLYTGHNGFAGELGHITIDRNGPVDNCGNVGCLEVMASGTAVGRMARERLASGESSSLTENGGGEIESVNAQMVSEAARQGDALARSVMDEVATNLGIGIVSLLHAFDPEIIVIGGGMSNSLDLLLEGIEAEIDRHAMGNLKGSRPVVKSKLGDDVGLLGAAALVFGRNEVA